MYTSMPFQAESKPAKASLAALVVFLQGVDGLTSVGRTP
jgi:hypothetical protein